MICRADRGYVLTRKRLFSPVKYKLNWNKKSPQIVDLKRPMSRTNNFPENLPESFVGGLCLRKGNEGFDD